MLRDSTRDSLLHMIRIRCQLVGQDFLACQSGEYGAGHSMAETHGYLACARSA